MVGSPFQTAENLAEDLCFLERLQPEMVGIGPFISQRDTPFAGDFPGAGSCTRTLVMLGLIRLMLPRVLLPATTALGTIDRRAGRREFWQGPMWSCRICRRRSERGTVSAVRQQAGTGEEAAEGLALLEARMQSIGYRWWWTGGIIRNVSHGPFGQ